MQFEDLKKVWDEQNKTPMYIIDEEAMHKLVQGKKRRAALHSSINEIGLVLVSIITSVILLVLKNDTINNYVLVAVMASIGIFVLYRRWKRKRRVPLDFSKMKKNHNSN